MKVSDCMSRDVRICAPDHSVRDAARTMKEIGVGALPVGENDRLIGMITDRDIALRVVADGKSPDTKVREALTPEIHYVFEDEDLDDVAQRMGELKVRRLAVLSRQKRLVGIVSLGDIWTSQEAETGAEALTRVAQPGGPHLH